MGDYLFLSLYEAYTKAKRRKRPSHNQLAFEAKLLDNLHRLAYELHHGIWRPRAYTSFVAPKPKARQIHAPDFGDRVVHHWLVPQLEAIFEPKFIHDSYANRVGKGTHQAIAKLQRFMRCVYSSGDSGGDVAAGTPKSSTAGYYLQCDIANFFNSIHRPTLLDLLHRHTHALPAHVQGAMYRLLTTTVADSGVHYRATHQQLAAVPKHKRLECVATDCGLPIGNLSSQFFGNVYMNELDQFVKHVLKVRYYVRYVDDFVLLSHSQEQLMDWLAAIGHFLSSRLSLTLKQSPICRPLTAGVDFLGFVIFPHHTQVRRRVVANLRHKLHTLAQKPNRTKPSKMLSQQATPHIIRQLGFCHYFGRPSTRYYLYADVVGYQRLRSVYASYLGHIRHANHQKLLQKLHSDYPYLQCFDSKTQFAVSGWFEPRPIWLWTDLHPIATFTPLIQPIFTTSQEQYHETHPTKPPQTLNQGMQLCFDFEHGGEQPSPRSVRPQHSAHASRQPLYTDDRWQ